MDEFNISFDKPNFQQQYGTGTLSEQRAKTKPSVDTAGIIDASAKGLDSVTNFASLFMGKSPNSNQAPPPPPPPSRPRVNPVLIGGVGLGVVLLLVLLITSKNGKTK